MLIAILGLPNAGKNSLADHLVNTESFTRVFISAHGEYTSAVEESAPSTSCIPSSTSSSSATFYKNEKAIHFEQSSDFLNYATQHWRSNFVTTDLKSKVKLVEFAKRPFVVIVAVEAPLGVRFARARRTAEKKGLPTPSLESFVAADDAILFGPPGSNASAADATGYPSTGNLSSTLQLPKGLPDGLSPGFKRLSLSRTTDAPPSPIPSPRLSPTPSFSSSLPASSFQKPSGSESTNYYMECLSPLLHLASFTLSNPYTSLDAFLSSLSLPSLKAALRPPWDTYFMLLASLASLRSNCMKRRVGAVLVREKRVVSTGYNGTPRKVKNCGEGGCGRCNGYGDGFMIWPTISASPSSSVSPDTCHHDHDDGHDEHHNTLSSSTSNSNHIQSGSNLKETTLNGKEDGAAAAAPVQPSTTAGVRGMGEALDECLCLHAEENALLEAGRERVSGGGTEGAVLYCNTCPCLRCTVKIVQCGVIEVVYSLSYSMDTASRQVLEEAGVGLRQIEMPAFPNHNAIGSPDWSTLLVWHTACSRRA